jgi:hypothetical protein
LKPIIVKISESASRRSTRHAVGDDALPHERVGGPAVAPGAKQTDLGRACPPRLLEFDQRGRELPLRAFVSLVAAANEAPVGGRVALDVLHPQAAGSQGLQPSGEGESVQLAQEGLEGVQAGVVKNHRYANDASGDHGSPMRDSFVEGPRRRPFTFDWLRMLH